MRSQRPSSFADLPHRLRDRAETLGEDWKQWRADVHDDPRLLWRSSLIRVLLWVLLAIVIYLAARALLGDLFAAAPDADAAAAPTATLYTACTNSDCAHHFQTRQAMDFAAWPLECPACGQSSAYRARVCRRCQNWIATAPGAPSDACPHCDRVKSAETPPPIESAPVDPDDREDGW